MVDFSGLIERVMVVVDAVVRSVLEVGSRIHPKAGAHGGTQGDGFDKGPLGRCGAGADDGALPEEFRDALQGYFNGREGGR